jgi:hypothetical protein
MAEVLGTTKAGHDRTADPWRCHNNRNKHSKITHTTGEVRGYASLMQPAKPSPGVPFADLTAMRWSERLPPH